MRLISRGYLIFCVRFRRLKLCIRLHEYFGVQLECKGKYSNKSLTAFLESKGVSS